MDHYSREKSDRMPAVSETHWLGHLTSRRGTRPYL